LSITLEEEEGAVSHQRNGSVHLTQSLEQINKLIRLIFKIIIKNSDCGGTFSSDVKQYFFFNPRALPVWFC
jgi:Fe-S oxidoreductase